MINVKYLFPKGNNKALTLSYDDGVTQDKRLVGIFNENKLKATFNLNSGIQSESNFWTSNGITIRRMNEDGIKELYKGHEVAIHSLTHPNLANMPKQLAIEEVLQDKKNHEKTHGYVVRGMAYPYGTYNSSLIETLKTLGVEYSRTVNQHENFYLPQEPLAWDPTCHHKNEKLMDIANKFICDDSGDIKLFYVWGHSYEFDLDDNWEVIEKFSKLVGNKADIWYATNIEIIDYLNALKALKFSAEVEIVFNPSAITVWLNVDGRAVEVKAGETKNLQET